jgi:molybdopterin synthase catalytic subunit
MANYDSDVAVVDGALDVVAEKNISGAGAIVQFLGDVRPLENGERIDGIEYEAHQEMAEHQLQRIADEAAERFGLLAIRLHHRIGFVAVGETSLFLRVAAAHRAAAFDASQWIVDELKKRVPIWKSIRVGSDKANERAALV